MLTDSQKRALRAKTLLESGMNPAEAAKKCGYKGVNGMLGAISLCDARIQKNEAVFDGSLRSPDIHPQDGGEAAGTQTGAAIEPARGKDVRTTAKIYPVQFGKILIQKEDITVSYRPGGTSGGTVHIIDEAYRRKTGKAKWFGIVGVDAGGKEALALMLRQISEATAECADLIEDGLRGGKQHVDRYA